MNYYNSAARAERLMMSAMVVLFDFVWITMIMIFP